MMNMQDAGLFKVKDKKAPGYFDWNWEKIKTVFNLLPGGEEGANLQNPSDISYVHNGFAPLSVSIIEMILKEGVSPLSQQGRGVLKQLGLTDDKLKIPNSE